MGQVDKVIRVVYGDTVCLSLPIFLGKLHSLDISCSPLGFWNYFIFCLDQLLLFYCYTLVRYPDLK